MFLCSRLCACARLGVACLCERLPSHVLSETLT
jgi:hypothetical protein